MSGIANPAFDHFAAQLGEGLVFGQVWIRQISAGYTLRHIDDRYRTDSLKPISMAELRNIVQYSGRREFRPLKSAPNLLSGWSLDLQSGDELAAALDELYPNSIADWFAARLPVPPVTHYREFTARQTGMYRIATMLNHEQVVPVIRSCCHQDFCLKRRLWTDGNLPIDSAETKSLIPCLEPCALLLEFARKSMRIEQGTQIDVVLSEEDWASIGAALEIAARQSGNDIREADFNSAGNLRRLKRVLEKLEPTLARVSAKETE